jgi:hypothetical protein
VSQEQKNHVAEDVSSGPSASPLPPTTSDSSAVEENQKAQMAEGTEGSAETVDTAAGVPAKKRKRKTRLVNVEEISPRASYWPIVLALSLAMVLFGVIAGPVVEIIGVVLVIVSVSGWVLERR